MNVSCVLMLATAKILRCLKRSLANHAVNRRWTGAIVVCFIESIYRLCDSIVMFCSNKMAVVVRTSLLALLSKFQKRSKKNCQWMSMVWIVRCSPICAICLHTRLTCITRTHNHRLAPAPCHKVGLESCQCANIRVRVRGVVRWVSWFSIGKRAWGQHPL